VTVLKSGLLIFGVGS